MLKIVGDSLLEPFTLVLLSKAVKTCANNASCRLPFLGRCCVCTLPLPCGETSHHYQNEMILSGQYEPSNLEAQNVQGGSSAAAYYTRSLEANLTSALSEFGLSLLPPSRAACLDASPLGVASEREGGATCSPCSRPATARLIGGSPRDQQSEPPPIQILWPQKDPKRRSAAAQIGRGKAVAEGGIQGNSDFGEYRPPQATLPSPTVKKNTSSTLPSGFSIANKQPGFKRSYQEALLEPLQLRSPQGLSGFPRNQPAGDLVQSPFTAAALSDGGARDQAAYLCDMLFAGCLPERYRRDREVAMESVESKRKSKEIEAAQVSTCCLKSPYGSDQASRRLLWSHKLSF
ncbi:hypothetical protein TGRUB_225590 [Toxoplasma gondii RUB]|uniref:Uncharacterized protein n=4 Tax=Toxoplasma gondii TaxID=5811 RepID=S7W5K0_TOXGG|nr:hypothetical protein TGGT1_225590 [Toxoplasma gondii GT1]KAF4640605.1 hypothetical protein TGRH88_045310 [Toxoplasma gondii]KFG42849.1 hypothetical protein TGP89_225590 [Toxoplasma gondii p89]KFG60811.1 hypothetical protein TGRUB_225590 [Toxoplasma gondii RUB]